MLEIVVAVAIFAVIVSIVFPALLQFLDMRDRVVEKQQEIVQLQKTFLFLSNDLRFASSRLSKDEFGELAKTTMQLNDDYLLSFTSSYPDLTMDGASVPRRVQWQLENGRLSRKQFPVMDPTSDTKAYTQDLLDNIRSVEFTSYAVEDSRIEEDDKWEESTRLPDMLKVNIKMENGGTYSRSFTMMGG